MKSIRRLQALTCCCFLSITACGGAEYKKLGLPDFIVGTITHFGQSKGIVKSNISMLKQAHIDSLRDEVFWAVCEREKGKLTMPVHFRKYIDSAVDNGIMPLIILDYGSRFYDGAGYPRSDEAVNAFARYSEFAVRKLRGKVRLFQVWNEWDGGCGMRAELKRTGDPESYIKLLKAVYPKIKKANGNAAVIANPVCTGDAYLEKLLKLNLLKYCDVVALHTYNFGDSAATPEDWLKRMKRVGVMLRKYNSGSEVPLYITEMGWPTQLGATGRPQGEAASYLVRLYLLARTIPYVKGIWWYDFQDDGWNANYFENNFGLVRPDLMPKQGYYAMKDIAPVVKHCTFVKRLNAGDPKIWSLLYKLEDGRDVVALWSTYRDDDWELSLKSEQSAGKNCILLVPGRGKTKIIFGSREWFRSKKAAFDASRLQLIVRGRPCILIGKLADVRITGVTKRKFPENTRPKHRLMVVPEKIAVAAKANSGKKTKTYFFGSDRDYRRIDGTPKHKDFSASFSMHWSKSHLSLKVVVDKASFHQDYIGSDTWKGDGLQMAFRPLETGGSADAGHFDFDVALTKDGPQVYRQFGGFGPGLTKDIACKIARSGHQTIYEMMIPAAVVGVKRFKAGMVFGFSLVVNCNDGKTRKGYLHWGDGIGLSKDPTQYNWITLED